ncbi:MAG: hypothetical protein ABIQ18_15155 [Umezawaea sp.]
MGRHDQGLRGPRRRERIPAGHRTRGHRSAPFRRSSLTSFPISPSAPPWALFCCPGGIPISDEPRTDAPSTPPAVPAEGTTGSTGPGEVPSWIQTLLANVNAKSTTTGDDAGTAATATDEVRAEYEAKFTELAAQTAAVAAELEAQRLSGLRVQVALNAGFPAASVTEFADLLKGSNEAELTAHAQKLKGLFDAAAPVAPRAVDPTQGATGPIDPDPTPGLGRLRNAYRD